MYNFGTQNKFDTRSQNFCCMELVEQYDAIYCQKIYTLSCKYWSVLAGILLAVNSTYFLFGKTYLQFLNVFDFNKKSSEDWLK